MTTTTPQRLTRRLNQLIERVAPGARPQTVPVCPDQRAVLNECFPQVEDRIRVDGGRMVCGWLLWEWPHVLVEAEFHACWSPNDDELLDITPKYNGEEHVWFVRDARRNYDGRARDNVRLPLRDDQLIDHFIAAAEATFRVLNRGARAFDYGIVTVPANEIMPLTRMKSFCGTAIESGLRDHDPCLCGSGGKYKRCCARPHAAILARCEP
jgi:hypothetical protein